MNPSNFHQKGKIIIKLRITYTLINGKKAKANNKQ